MKLDDLEADIEPSEKLANFSFRSFLLFSVVRVNFCTAAKLANLVAITLAKCAR
jgi:hypothetical protein